MCNGGRESEREREREREGRGEKRRITVFLFFALFMVCCVRKGNDQQKILRSFLWVENMYDLQTVLRGMIDRAEGLNRNKKQPK